MVWIKNINGALTYQQWNCQLSGLIDVHAVCFIPNTFNVWCLDFVILMATNVLQTLAIICFGFGVMFFSGCNSGLICMIPG